MHDRDFLRAVIDGTSEAVFVKDIDGRYVYLNEAARSLIGRPIEAILGKDERSVFPRSHVATARMEADRAVLANGEVQSTEEQVAHPDGSHRTYQATTGPVHDASGAIAGVYCISRDVTERRATEAALARSETQLRYLVENAPTCMAMLDRRMNYVATSARWIEQYGGGRTNLVGENLYETSQHVPESWKDIHRAVEAGEGQRNDDESGLLPDGTMYWIRWAAYPWTDARGQIGGVITSVEDISALKLAEAAHRSLNVELERRVDERTAELRSANEELDSFAYAVSHDLRAPLRAINGFSLALQEDFAATLPLPAREHLDEIRTAARRMALLVEGLLTLCRSTRGSGLRGGRVDISALAVVIQKELERGEPERQVSWEIEPGITVTGDAVMLESVLRNLLGNAWKYTAKTAAPVVRLHREVGSSFSVSDNGAGFNMDHAARLFKPFQRMHRQDEFPGLGIGLATVQRILHRHGGGATAVGAPDCGATFTVSLPESPPDAA